ncbi:hypothetical protein ACFL54_02375 [Planctomycetota bacterium]
MALDDAQVTAFVKTLQRQNELYSQLIEMAQLQVELLEKDDDKGVYFLLAKKQEKIAEIDNLEAKLKPIKQNWERVREHFSEERLAEAEESLLKVRETLGNLIELENRWARILEEKKHHTRSKLDKLEKGRRMNQAYQVQDPKDPRYMDKTE